MKALLILTALIPSLSWASCPSEMTVDSKNYCYDFRWLQSDIKEAGQLEPYEAPSPHLLPMGLAPQKWIYSKASFKVWVKGDTNKTPVELPNFQIFPYMTMNNGHHHSTSHIFTFDKTTQSYIVSSIAFQEMPGCWSFRWTTTDAHTLDASELLFVIDNYENLTPEDNQQLKTSCTD